MKKHSTRFLALALALAAGLLLPTLASCAEEHDDPTDTTATETIGDIVTEPEETEITDKLPDELYYNNDEVVILSRYVQNWTSGEITPEEGITGNRVNDTVYERNKHVEERLGVKLTNVQDNDPHYSVVVNRVSGLVKSGTHEYDLLAAAAVGTMNASLEGTFVDLRTTQYLDFDKPWWSQGVNNATEYKDMQFAVSGDMLLSLYRFAFVTVFNKDLFDDVGIPHLYEDVQKGTWTLDRQTDLVTQFHIDNGNGVQDADGDVYGLITNDHLSVDPYWGSGKVEIVGKDENGDYEVIFDSAKLHDVCDKVLRLYYDTQQSVYIIKTQGTNNEEQIVVRDTFAKGYGAMGTVRIMELEAASMRNMQQEYGVVPMPKFNAEQDGYRTIMHDQFTVMSIPTTAGEERSDELSAVLEALASISYRILRPAYYETALRTQIAQDPESSEMLDLVIDNIYIDVGQLYPFALGTFAETFRLTIQGRTNTITSGYKVLMTKLEGRALPAMVKKLNKLNDRD